MPLYIFFRLCCAYKKKRAKLTSKRTHTRIYHLAGREVCSKMYIQTLRISSARVDRYLKKVSSTNVIKDRRGEKTAIHRKMPEDRRQRIIDHISKFPKYKSHYCRNQSERLFLNSDVTLDKMFNLYKEEHQDSVSFSSYKRIFYDNFNLQRKRLKKDTCNKCDNFAVKIQSSTSEQEKKQFERLRDTHQDEAKAARNLMNSDLQKAKNEENVEVMALSIQDIILDVLDLCPLGLN
ncbi:unnamed protein product [Diabrotica balteata]|uniref:Uncharacterized protein n=1 Tax=Diabrotica balteata TaxID=107213 RepID=A0A9N9SQY7_DIABA|nr:unnamed protein product [Diabrotica balteata]